MELNSAGLLLNRLDWQSIGVVAGFAGFGLASLTVKHCYQSIASGGRVPMLFAHVVVANFGIGMFAFGAWATLHRYFPLPGGPGWEGGIAVVGGIAAMTAGGCTLVDHFVKLRATSREPIAVLQEAGVPGN